MNIKSTFTDLYGVIGNPVEHSKSPIIFNAAFKKHQHAGVYLPFRVEKAQSAIDAMRTLGIKGFSVTIPHKQAVYSLVDKVDQHAQPLEAINTVINQQGTLTGYNFDGEGAILALQEILPSWRNASILIVGAGGAAYGIALSMACKYQHPHIDLLVRNQQKARTLQKRLQQANTTCNLYTYNHFVDEIAIKKRFSEYRVLINTTPVGMHPHTNDSPVPSSFIHKNMVVFDIVYNPINTLLLKQAKQKGATTLDGRMMFLHQASLQYQLWTGKNFLPKNFLKYL